MTTTTIPKRTLAAKRTLDEIGADTLTLAAAVEMYRDEPTGYTVPAGAVVRRGGLCRATVISNGGETNGREVSLKGATVDH